MLNSTNLMYNQFETGSRMNSRIQYRLCTLFAILLFLLVGIVIFVLVYSLQDPPKQEQVQPQIVKETISIDTHVEDPPVSTQDTEFVKPMKISPLPLHHHDMLYDQMRNNQGQAPIRHHSGHFRPKNAEVWDPHPQYEIDAFGKKLVLELAHNDRFLSPNVNVIHVWENYTQRIKHRPKTSGCFYSGNIKGDFHSMVVVSLCHGMTGYIKTSDGGDYYIEPAETFEDDSTSSILHLIRKVASSAEESGFGDLDSDQCETKGQMFEKTEVFDDEDVVEDHRHIINRRSLPDHSSVNHYPTEDRRRPQVHSSNQYYIEAMVVADKKMAQYHKSDEALLHYILTLMSHVALLYKDVTIGNPITLAVVEIVILKDRHFESSSSHVMLSEFCEYQHRNSRNFHDVAILLTREMICKNTTSEICKTLGVAEVGSMCSSKSSCAIVRDRGLSTSYTIAHELGHVLRRWNVSACPTTTTRSASSTTGRSRPATS